MHWNTFSYDALIRQKGYAFNYDQFNRLTDARYAAKSTAVSDWDTDKGYFNVQDIHYDANGNIDDLYRLHEGMAMDKLDYKYGSSNQLLSVEDFEDKSLGFQDGVDVAEE